MPVTGAFFGLDVHERPEAKGFCAVVSGRETLRYGPVQGGPGNGERAN